MTPSDRQRLREVAIRAAIEVSRSRAEFASVTLSGEWRLQTSNSFRRIGCRGDGDVLCATTQRSDGHPDLLAPPGVLEYVVAAQPHVVLQLLEHIDALEQKLRKGS